MSALFEPVKFGRKSAILGVPISESEAFDELEKAASWIVKNARWIGLAPSKVSELRRPLLKLRLARRNLKRQTDL